MVPGPCSVETQTEELLYQVVGENIDVVAKLGRVDQGGQVQLETNQVEI